MNDIVENIEALSAGNGLANGAVTTPKLQDGSVTGDKLASGAILLSAPALRTSSFPTTSTSPVQVPGLTKTVTVPTGGRDLEIEVYIPYIDAVGLTSFEISIWDGTVGSGTRLNLSGGTINANAYRLPAICKAYPSASAGSKTYNVGFSSSAGNTCTIQSGATAPAILTVKRV